MANHYIATIDCGSSNVRCIIFDIDSGRQVSVASRDWYVPLNSSIPGAYDFNDKLNWSIVCECTKSALSTVNPDDVIAVTASGFRHGIFCIDDKNDEVLYGCFNMDSRIDNSYFQAHNLDRQIFNLTGDWPTLHGISRLMWLKSHNPAAFERVGKFIMVSDWIVFKLCGEIAVEPGDASSTLLLDLKSRQWSHELMEKCGIPENIFPEIVDAGTLIGSIGEKSSRETGFSKGTKVFCGVADTQAGLVGVGAVGVNASAIIGGTYWLDCHITDKPMVDKEYRTRLSCHTERGQWIYEGVGFYIGLIVRWFRDVFGTQEKMLAKEYGLNAYNLLDRLTLDVPAGSYGMQVLMSDVANQQNWRMCTPTFMGWDMLNPAKSHKGVFFKAILENACYTAYGEFANIQRILGEDCISDHIILSGGAAHSDVWCQILSDVLGKPVTTTIEREGTAIGAAIYAAVGAGIYGNTAEAVSKIVRQDRIFEPNLHNHEIYMDEYLRWRELYKNGLTLLDRGLVKSMWQPDSTLTDTQRANPWNLR